MSTNNFQKVKEFHSVFRLPILDTASFPSKERADLRRRLILEEYDELVHALKRHYVLNINSLDEVADALTDLAYVIYGMALEFGIDLDKCFEEVHRSNMSKLDENGQPIFRSDGKVLKGPNFRSPDLKRVLFG